MKPIGVAGSMDKPGVNGVEWFSHPWELGIRKAKEMLFTGDPVSALEAYNLGMVKHVVPRERLPEFTMELAAARGGDEAKADD